MTHFQKSDLVVDGVRVQILEAGKGKPLIYFHGAGASRGFDELLPLAEKHRLIVPIHPGFGGSDDDLSINSVLDYVVHCARCSMRLSSTSRSTWSAIRLAAGLRVSLRYSRAIACTGWRSRARQVCAFRNTRARICS